MVSRIFQMAAASVLLSVAGAPALAQSPKISLAGRWTLNRALSEFPREVGFGADFLSAATAATAAETTSRGAGPGGTPVVPAFDPARQSLEDARREALLVRLVKDPSPHLTIAQTETTVTLTDDRGRALTLHTDGKAESQTFDDIVVTTTARWESDRLVVRYRLAQDREVRYTFFRTVERAPLSVQTQLIERGGRATVTRVYDAARPDEPASPDWDRPAAAPAAAAATTGPLNLGTELGQPVSSPAQTPPQAPVAAVGPDGELKGLAALGVVVEASGGQAGGCGVSEASINAAVTKSFRDAGLTVRPDSDDDTYAYVRIITVTGAGGACVSRYDVFLYTHTAGTLSYQTAPLLLQVQLLHEGGLTGGAAATHGEAVLKNVTQLADAIAARIKAVNRSPRRLAAAVAAPAWAGLIVRRPTRASAACWPRARACAGAGSSA